METGTANSVASDNYMGSSLLAERRCLNGQTRVKQLLRLSLGGKYRDGGWVLHDQRSRVISHNHSGRSCRFYDRFVNE